MNPLRRAPNIFLARGVRRDARNPQQLTETLKVSLLMLDEIVALDTPDRRIYRIDLDGGFRVILHQARHTMMPGVIVRVRPCAGVEDERELLQQI